jgi:tRNA(Arg) A34 adenosine deaminase TadA
MKKILVLFVVLCHIAYAKNIVLATNNQLNYETYMQKLIQLINSKKPKAPFAAMIIDSNSGKILCTSVNTQVEILNPINQAEVNAISACGQKYGKQLSWNDTTLVTTAAPSIMAMGAIIIRGIGKVVYGTSIKYLIDHNWQQIKIDPEEIEERSFYRHKVTLVGGILASKTNLLYKDGPPQVNF